MARKLTILVHGRILTYPYGGVFWDYVQYVLGLARMGHDVYYFEDHGEWVFDRCTLEKGYTAEENKRAIANNLKAYRQFMDWLGEGEQGGKVCFIDDEDGCSGICKDDWFRIAKRADVFLNISMGSRMREEYARIPTRILIDSDPMYSQSGFPDYEAGRADEKLIKAMETLKAHNAFFSFGELVGTPGCLVPTGGIDWTPTRQPMCLDMWETDRRPYPGLFTSVLSWEPENRSLEVGGVKYFGKSQEFLKILDLPKRPACSGALLEVALGGGKPPKDRLEAAGWRLADGWGASYNPFVYRDYIQTSMAEFSPAKNAYVASRSGWFSCRTTCYLAAGRPAVVQDTGFSEIFETGRGVVAFEDLDGAARGVASVLADPAGHAQAAKDFVKRHFDAPDVLGRLLADAGAL